MNVHDKIEGNDMEEKYFVAFWDCEGGGVVECDSLKLAKKQIKEFEEESDDTGCVVQGIIKGSWVEGFRG
jgi:hypothetical protein